MSSNKENQTNASEMQDFESNAIALYNQQIIQILCSDTLELEIELARDLVSACRHARSEKVHPSSLAAIIVRNIIVVVDAVVVVDHERCHIVASLA